MARVAVIGAGMAGLTCAALLSAAGIRPLVYDKSRGLGGRLATRRWDHGQFDHGCPYIKPKSPGFAEAVKRFAVAPWGEGRFVGTPGMSSLVAPLAEGVNILRGVEVREVARVDGGLRVMADGVDPRDFDRVLIAVPGPQIKRFAPEFAKTVRDVEMAPCLTAMLAFDEELPLPNMPDGLPEAIGWCVRDSAKPGRSGEAWIIQASPDWSVAHLELEKPAIAERLLVEFQGVVGATLPEPTYMGGHRWRFSVTSRPLGQAYVSQAGIYAAGDWCLGAEVEAAWESGRAVAAAVLADLG